MDDRPPGEERASKCSGAQDGAYASSVNGDGSSGRPGRSEAVDHGTPADTIAVRVQPASLTHRTGAFIARLCAMSREAPHG
jgi:hypothetical protein